MERIPVDKDYNWEDRAYFDDVHLWITARFKVFNYEDLEPLHLENIKKMLKRHNVDDKFPVLMALEK